MGLEVYAHIHQAEDVAFDDLAALNDDLEANTDIGFLVEEALSEPDYNGFFKLDGPNDLKFAILTDKEFSDYGYSWCMVHGYFEREVAKTISKHLRRGKIVIRKEIEGNDTQFYVITPDNVGMKSINDVRF